MKKRDGHKSVFGRRGMWQALNASSAGLVFFLSIAVGVGIGWYLDKVFGSKPYLLLFFLAMGIIAGFKNLWLFIKRSQKAPEEEEKAGHEK